MPVDKDLQEIIDVVAEGTTTLIKQLGDGFQYTDIFALIPVLSKIPEAIKDADHALNYLKDLTEEKENEVIAAVLAKLQDTSDKTKAIVKYLLRTLASIYMLYLTLVPAVKPVVLTSPMPGYPNP